MAITKYAPEPGFGTLLGTGLGAGIGKGLQELAQHKMEQYKTRQQGTRTTQALEQLGIAPETAKGIAALPQNMQVEYIKNMRRQQQQQALQQVLGGLGQGEQGAPMGAGQQPAPGQQLGGPPTAQQGGVAGAFGGGEIPVQQQLQLAQMGQRERLAAQKMKQRDRLAEQKITARQQEQIDKETLPVLRAFEKSSSAADVEIQNLNEFKRLGQEGGTGSPLTNAFSKWGMQSILGKDIPTDWVLPTNAQKQIKLSANFLKDAIQTIEGRKSRYLLKQLSKAYPNIWQSPKAQEYIVDILRYENYAKKAKTNIAYDIIEKNAGLRPRNLKSLVEKRFAKIDESLRKRIIPSINFS